MTPSTQAFFNLVMLAIVGPTVTFLMAWFWWAKNKAIADAKVLSDERKEDQERITELESKLVRLDQAVIPISMAFQAILIKELTHYHTPEMDALMKKIGPPNILSDAEEARLSVLLEARTRDMGPEISEAERDAAIILPYIIKRTRIEENDALTADVSKLKVVTLVGIPNEDSYPNGNTD